VKLWDLQSGAALATLKGHSDWVRLVLVLPDGRRIVSCSLDTTVRIWDVASGRVQVLSGHTAAITAAAVSNDGSRLVTGAGDGSLCVWDTATGDRQLVLSGHRGAICGCAFAEQIMSAGRDGVLRLWDPATGEMRTEMIEHSRPVHSCALSPDRRHVASAGEDSFVMVWDLATGKKRSEYWTGAPALSVTWHPAHQRIAAGDARGTVHLLDIEGRAG
jgi:WD40 repeat protein